MTARESRDNFGQSLQVSMSSTRTQCAYVGISINYTISRYLPSMASLRVTMLLFVHAIIYKAILLFQKLSWFFFWFYTYIHSFLLQLYFLMKNLFSSGASQILDIRKIIFLF